jgi:hypothetical protein
MELSNETQAGPGLQGNIVDSGSDTEDEDLPPVTPYSLAAMTISILYSAEDVNCALERQLAKAYQVLIANLEPTQCDDVNAVVTHGGKKLWMLLDGIAASIPSPSNYRYVIPYNIVIRAARANLRSMRPPAVMPLQPSDPASPLPAPAAMSMPPPVQRLQESSASNRAPDIGVAADAADAADDEDDEDDEVIPDVPTYSLAGIAIWLLYNAIGATNCAQKQQLAQSYRVVIANLEFAQFNDITSVVDHGGKKLWLLFEAGTATIRVERLPLCAIGQFRYIADTVATHLQEFRPAPAVPLPVPVPVMMYPL